MCLIFSINQKGWCNMKNRIIIFALIISQFLAGCIAFIPPSHRSETVVIIEYPYPVPVEPPYHNPVEPPNKPAPPPHVEPEKPIKERAHKNNDSDRERERRNPVSDANENRRNSGERSRR